MAGPGPTKEDRINKDGTTRKVRGPNKKKKAVTADTNLLTVLETEDWYRIAHDTLSEDFLRGHIAEAKVRGVRQFWRAEVERYQRNAEFLSPDRDKSPEAVAKRARYRAVNAKKHRWAIVEDEDALEAEQQASLGAAPQTPALSVVHMQTATSTTRLPWPIENGLLGPDGTADPFEVEMGPPSMEEQMEMWGKIRDRNAPTTKERANILHNTALLETYDRIMSELKEQSEILNELAGRCGFIDYQELVIFFPKHTEEELIERWGHSLYTEVEPIFCENAVRLRADFIAKFKRSQIYLYAADVV